MRWGERDNSLAGRFVSLKDLALEVGELGVLEDVFDGRNAARVEDVDLAGERFAQAIEQAGRLEGRNDRAATSAGTAGDASGPMTAMV